MVNPSNQKVLARAPFSTKEGINHAIEVAAEAYKSWNQTNIMNNVNRNPNDKILFTPGPLTTSMTVKESMLSDYGSRDLFFITTIRETREKLLEITGLSQEKGYEAIIMQGSGTFGIESTITTAIPRDGHLLLLINGAYGTRMKKIAEVNQIKVSSIEYPENMTPDPSELDNYLGNNPPVTHVAVVHCETTTGIFNPIREIGEVVNRHGKIYMIDAMSSFGAVPVNFEEFHIDYLISSSNKCIEGVPGFSFTIAKKETLLKTKGQSRTLSLDLFAQWEGLEANGQFRFTPPTHAIVAFRQALKELEEEGGVDARAERYLKNYNTLITGMRLAGFKEYLEPEKQGYIITSFFFPEHPNFDFNTFYEKLNEKGQVIYPGKLSKSDCFRIGNIGKIFPDDIKKLIEIIGKVLRDMDVEL